MPIITHTLHTPLAILLARLLADRVRQAAERFERWRVARRTHDSLASLDDRMLRDLGFHRSEISSIVANPDDAHRLRAMSPFWGGR